MKDVPEEAEVLHAKSEDLSQNVAVLRFVKMIRVTAIRGNWALVTAVDVDRIPKTGFLKWRSSDGIIYAFPNIE